jgi:hypothetical protein
MKYFLFGFLLLNLASCTNRNKKTPDVSHIQVDLKTLRFEQDFFSLDTSNLPAGLQALQQKYPVFLQDFTANILGLSLEDTSGLSSAAIKQFLSDYRPINDSARILFNDFSRYESQIRKGIQLLKYYFPQYKAPNQLITFIGPMDAYAEGQTGGYGDIITRDALGIGLQLHLGSQFSFYTSEIGQSLYPAYISRRFDPAWIPVNCMKNLVDDLYPGSGQDKSLLDLMVDKGKRLYLLELLLPDAADTLITGYTKIQLEGAMKNEGLIWNFFTENNLLYETDLQKIRSYITDGPKTVELGDASPGYIALFTGRQLVSAYMKQFPETSPSELFQIDPETMLKGANYKPK